MQSIATRSLIIGLLVACNGHAGTGNEDSQAPAEPAPSAAAEPARATRDTDVAFNVSGLSAWKQGDSLQLVSQRRGVVLSGIESQLAAAPGAGETTVAGAAINWKHTPAPLFDASQGDKLLLTQLVTGVSNGRVYSALARAGEVSGLALRDGHPASLASALAPVAQTSLALRWKGSAFAALTAAAAAGPGAEPAGAATIAISALPDALGKRDLAAELYAGLPSLVTFAPLPGADLDQAVTYGNPFPQLGGTWHELATVVYAATVPVPTRWGVGSVPARMVAAIPVAQLRQAGELAQQLSPVRDVKRDGSSLSWTAPSLGKADGYSLVISAVTGDDQGPRITPVATLTTKDTAIELPELAAGTYVVTITAIANGKGRAFASADHVTAQLAL